MKKHSATISAWQSRVHASLETDGYLLSRFAFFRGVRPGRFEKAWTERL
jgi:hypothetical protein